MRVARIILTLLILSPAAASLARAADGPPALAHNPFSRPPSETLVPAPSTDGDDGPTLRVLELRATMIGKTSKLANVGGRVLKRGDEVQGYVLVAIQEQYAVFRRNGEDTTVYVKPLAGNDE